MTRRMIRFGSLSAVVSGFLLIILTLMLVVDMFLPAIPGVLFTALALSADILLVFALIGLYVGAGEELGKLSSVGFVLMIAGTMIELARFFSPVGNILFLLGLVSFSLAVYRAQKAYRWAFWLWVAGLVVFMVAGVFNLHRILSLGVLLAGVSRIWWGALWPAE
jgi:hypothetical protein